MRSQFQPAGAFRAARRAFQTVALDRDWLFQRAIFSARSHWRAARPVSLFRAPSVRLRQHFADLSALSNRVHRRLVAFFLSPVVKYHGLGLALPGCAEPGALAQSSPCVWFCAHVFARWQPLRDWCFAAGYAASREGRASDPKLEQATAAASSPLPAAQQAVEAGGRVVASAPAAESELRSQRPPVVPLHPSMPRLSPRGRSLTAVRWAGDDRTRRPQNRLFEVWLGHD